MHHLTSEGSLPALMPATRRAATWLLMLAVVAAAGCGGSARPRGAAPQTSLLLISLDGFRPDYLERFETPTLDRIAADGIRAEYLAPVFPTKTYPNHYTIVTGLYPDHHGVIFNESWDPEWQRRFDRGDIESPEYDAWWEGEPIWVTARKQGRTAATMFWPGSDAEIGGWRPNEWMRYDGSIGRDARVDRVVEWFDRPAAERPALVTLYFSDVDEMGHRYGPMSDEVGQAVRALDESLGRLLSELDVRGLARQVDLLVVSDHGMAESPPDQVVAIDTAYDPEDGPIRHPSPTLAFWPVAGRLAGLASRLATVSHLTVYRREDLPARWHLGSHRRVPPLLGVADEGWTIGLEASLARARARGRWPLGEHGYDNALPSMRAILVARGPHFRRGVVVPPLENVHLYELMCRVLGLTPASNDGRLEAVAHLLTVE